MSENTTETIRTHEGLIIRSLWSHAFALGKRVAANRVVSNDRHDHIYSEMRKLAAVSNSLNAEFPNLRKGDRSRLFNSFRDGIEIGHELFG